MKEDDVHYRINVLTNYSDYHHTDQVSLSKVRVRVLKLYSKIIQSEYLMYWIKCSDWLGFLSTSTKIVLKCFMTVRPNKLYHHHYL
jgi:hypothetical protein